MHEVRENNEQVNVLQSPANISQMSSCRFPVFRIRRDFLLGVPKSYKYCPICKMFCSLNFKNCFLIGSY